MQDCAWIHPHMLFLTAALFAPVNAIVNPITVRNAHFVDSVTGKPFLIKGVDYQPGGSSSNFEWSDPLSDVESCARDIYLFQKLGINTVRVYTVNPYLNHDACMSMLAMAGIYLVLDVNSPRVGESLNRYEPWTTYGPDYLQRIFQVVEQFSWYNNTLAFFMGNEIVNDERSAIVSPPYIRAVTRDIKDYIRYNSPRIIPVGYSAADDLRYRIPLADYLTCGDDDSAVDFYGVNSYQWCGEQTFQTSGYDLLVRDHEKFTVPIFLSEFGCNLVRPRLFQEVEMLFSPSMTHVFSGGLVYEFTQEVNNYGLVTLNANGSASLNSDFETLREKFSNVVADSSTIPVLSKPQPRQKCGTYYESFSPSYEEPNSFGTEMIRNGVRVMRGQYLPQFELRESKYEIYDANNDLMADCRITPVVELDSEASASPTANETSSLNGVELRVSTPSKAAPSPELIDQKQLRNVVPDEPKIQGNPEEGIVNAPGYRYPHRYRPVERAESQHKDTQKYESSSSSGIAHSLWLIGLSLLVSFLLALNYQ